MTPAIGNTGQPRITLRMVFEHMLNMEQRLTQRINEVEHRLTKRIDGVENSLTQRMDRFDIKLDQLNAKVDRNHINLSAQIGMIDQRLDTVEVIELPKLKKRIRVR